MQYLLVVLTTRINIVRPNIHLYVQVLQFPTTRDTVQLYRLDQYIMHIQLFIHVHSFTSVYNMLSVEPLYTQQIVDKSILISWISPSRHATVAEVVVVLLAWVPVTLGTAQGKGSSRAPRDVISEVVPINVVQLDPLVFSGATKKMKDLFKTKSPPKSYALKKKKNEL